MIAFASFVDASDKDFSMTFLEWIKVSVSIHVSQCSASSFFVKARTEIGKYVCELPDTLLLLTFLFFSSQVRFLRKTYGSKLNVFAPINDLSSLSKSGSETRSLVAGKKNDLAISGGQILGDEYTDHVIKVNINSFTTYHLTPI
jgi:hypothetical protein